MSRQKRRSRGRGPALLLMMGMMVWGVTPLYAADLLPQPGVWNFGVRSGYSISERKVDTVPVNLHIGYTLFKGKKWRIPAGALEVAAEPFASPVTRVTQPGRRSGSIEAGLMLPVLTYHFDLGSRISPYLEGGLGALYHDLQGFDLGGGFSFTEMVGVGATYFLDDNLALNVGYRFRHTSNASIYEDNRGLNSHAFMAGFSYFLPQH